MNLTGERIKALRKERGLKQADIAHVLGLTKQIVSKIENGTRAIAPSEQKVLNLYFFGDVPEGISRSDGVLEFKEDEWLLIEQMARREGYESGRAWIVSKIRVYLAQLPNNTKPLSPPKKSTDKTA